MARTRKIFSAFDKDDLDYLALCYKAIETKGATQVEAFVQARKKLSTLPEGGIINLFCAPSPDNKIRAQVEKIKQFCREDKELQGVWEKKLESKLNVSKETSESKKTHYITKETSTIDGKKISVFDHYLGFICNAAFMDARFDRQDRAKAVLLAADYHNYHALLVKCESILTILRKKPDALSQQQQHFNATLHVLGNVFWSLGYLQSGCMLHQLKKIYKDDVKLDDQMMQEFVKAEALIETAESTYLYSAVRGEKSLSEFLTQVFAVDTIEKVKQKLEGDFTSEVFTINRDRAYADMINELTQVLYEIDDESDEISQEEEAKVSGLRAEIESNKLKSAKIDGLLKNSLLKQTQSAPVKLEVKQKSPGLDNK